MGAWRSTLRFAPIPALALIPALAVAGPVYRWEAPDGSIHYGETPPGPGAKAMELEVRTPPTPGRPDPVPDLTGQASAGGSAQNAAQNAAQDSAHNAARDPAGTGMHASLRVFEGRSPVEPATNISLRIRPAASRGTWTRVRTTFRDGRVYFPPPAPGRYQALLVVDTDGDGRANGPGDLRGLGVFDNRKGEREHKVQLSRLIHLLSPVDNRFPVTALDAQCTGKAPTLPTTLPVAWRTLGPKAVFTWRVRKVRCQPFAILESVAAATTTGNRAELNLPPSGPNEGWIFELRANEQGRETGRLLTLDEQGMHWHYRFRTQNEADAKPEQ